MSGKTIVLDHDRAQRKITRIVHQLHEDYHEEAGIVLVGVAPRGHTLAKRLQQMLAEATTLNVELVELKLDKDTPLERPAKLSVDPASLRDRVVVLVDDVLMSGRTLMHASCVAWRKTSTVLFDTLHAGYL